MKASQLKRWLESQGCTFEEGASHWIVRYRDRMTTVPRHTSKEIKTGTYHSILRKLGLKKTEVTGMEYFAKFEPDPDGGFVIEFPDFGWGVSQGDDEEDGRRMAADLLITMIQEHIRAGKELPKPGRFRGPKYRLIRLPASQGMKAELYLALRRSGMTKPQLARRIGIPSDQVDRLLNLSRRARIEQLEAAFAALGKQISIAIQDAA